MMDNKEWEKEKAKLQDIIQKYKEIMEYYNLKLEALPKIYKDNPYMLSNLMEMYMQKLRLMEKSRGKPYFARMNFHRDGETKVEELYIGKVGVMDEDNQNIVIDWRAPVASMYYDSNLGKASYKAPEGICTGELLLKRQYEIENESLKSFQDVDTVSNDELLKPYLNASADNRLKNIVSTIQKEQNEIIREPITKNMIIQGVAGSGKTTVALHRIAYLAYNNRDSIKPSQYLVIGPNKFFVNYISSVLPDLDVENVKQLTYQELCAEILQEEIQFMKEDEKLITSISKEQQLTYEKFKVSMQFKNLLDIWIQNKSKTILTKKAVEVKGYEIIAKETIQNIYFSIEENLIYNTIKKRLDRTNLMLTKYLEENKEFILENVRKQYQEKVSQLTKTMQEKELEKLNYVEKEIKNSCRASIQKCFKTILPNSISAYIEFLTNLKQNVNAEFYPLIEKKILANIKNIKEKKVEFEDLSALIYLQCKLWGIEAYEIYKQVVIDEAQDFGDFSFFALKSLLKNATFSIFGDLAQSIYQYRGIKDWKTVIKETFAEECEMKYLLKSYRTTTEIMHSANQITNYLNLNTAKPVIRHGKNVSYWKYQNQEEQICTIKTILKQYKENQYKTVAIICKEEEETTDIYNKLQAENREIHNITDSDTQYKGGICTITSYLAKGLEFDAVIVANASEEEYSSQKDIDMKLLYVAMTRPLHELNVLYHNSIVKPLCF